MNLIILFPKDRLDDLTYRLSDERADHILHILKAKVNDTVEIGLLNGQKGFARLTGIEKESITLIVENMSDPQPIKPTIDLICALPRPQTLKKVLAISACMGVRNIHLIRANRVEKSYFQSPLLEPENLNRYLIEGMAQGKLTRLPTVEIHDRFKPFVQELPERYSDSYKTLCKLLPDLCATESLQSFYKSYPDHILIAIGPEGGFVPFEAELFQSVGFVPISLGRSILRVENAVTAVLSHIELMIMMKN